MKPSRHSQEILRLALPAIVSNITVPLLGLADTAIVGHLGQSAYIGAIAVGGMVFSIVYWLFGFLRAGTSGFTSQAFGGGKAQEVTRSLLRSQLFALTFATLILLLQRPIADVAFSLVQASPDVEAAARIYFNICIWGAPAVLLLFGFNGWFIGLQDTRFTMLTAIIQNVTNVVVSLMLVFFAGMKVEGVALGTLVAQYVGLLTAVVLWRTHYHTYSHPGTWHSIVERAPLLRFFNVNRNIFLRTLCILTVTSFFTAMGARQNDLILAANSQLIQLFLLFSYFVDGFSNAGEALAGRYVGEHNADALRQMLRRLFRWGVWLSAGFTMIYLLFHSFILALLTDDPQVRTTALQFAPWIVAVPFAGFAAFLWDGVFIGVMATGRLFLSMFMATLGFFACFYLTFPHWGNHGLWLSFCLFLALRSAVQTFMFSSINRSIITKTTT